MKNSYEEIIDNLKNEFNALKKEMVMTKSVFQFKTGKILALNANLR